MAHVFGSRTTICQYKGVHEGSAYQFKGGAACYPKYTKSFAEARTVPCRTYWIMLDKLSSQSSPKEYTPHYSSYVMSAKDQFSRLRSLVMVNGQLVMLPLAVFPIFDTFLHSHQRRY